MFFSWPCICFQIHLVVKALRGFPQFDDLAGKS